MKHAVLALLLLVAASAAPQAQSAIIGRVVADASGDPISNARVSIDYPNNTDRVVALSDADGRFSLPVRPGRHKIVALKPRFAGGQVTVDAGTGAGDIRLRRSAVISGRIIDEFGDPVIAASVRVETGRTVTAAMATTDDRGEYRIGGLAAGTYATAVVTIGPPVFESLGGGRFSSSPRQTKTYYPNAASFAEAQSIELNWGDERAGVDLVLPVARAGVQAFDVGRGGSGQMTIVQTVRIARGAPAPAPAAAPSSSGVIRGRVIGADGVALPFAAVRLDARVVRADVDGRFEFRELSSGTHRVSASKAGYFMREMQVPLKQNETVDDRQLQLESWGTVAGRVFDQYGDPVQGARMEALQLRYEAGRRRLMPAQSLGSPTDDHGSYRLSGLRPGQYVISAAANGVLAMADLPGYVRTLFPGTALTTQAQFITVGQATEASGIDFGVVRAPTVTVSGRFVNAKDEPTGGSLQLLPSQYSLSILSASADARIYGDGRFEFPNVTPGEYIVQAYRGRTNGWTEGEFGVARVTVVDADVAGARIPRIAHSECRDRAHRRRRQGVGQLQTVRPITQHESCGFIPMCG